MADHNSRRGSGKKMLNETHAFTQCLKQLVCVLDIIDCDVFKCILRASCLNFDLVTRKVRLIVVNVCLEPRQNGIIKNYCSYRVLGFKMTKFLQISYTLTSKLKINAR